MVMISIKSIDALCARVGIKTQSELATKAGMMPQALNKVLKGHRAATLTTVDKICAALDCQPGAFLEYRPDEE